VNSDSRQQPARRVHIKRLDLDLRGVAPKTAESAVRLLGPALARALAGRRIDASAAQRIDAGRVSLAGATDAETVSTRLARRIAGGMSGD